MRAYLEGGPWDGHVTYSQVSVIHIGSDGYYELVEIFAQACEFLPNKHAMTGDRHYRWKHQPAYDPAMVLIDE